MCSWKLKGGLLSGFEGLSSRGALAEIGREELFPEVFVLASIVAVVFLDRDPCVQPIDFKRIINLCNLDI
jgi:hypothetical protein